MKWIAYRPQDNQSMDSWTFAINVIHRFPLRYASRIVPELRPKSRPSSASCTMILKFESISRDLRADQAPPATSSSAFIFPSGHAFGPSLQRFVRIRMRFHENSGYADSDRRTRQHRHEFALTAGLAACPPGNCTECVASKTTGHPVSRMTARLRMSETRLL